MAGRGRGQTLPAWMTRGGNGSAAEVAKGGESTPAAASSQAPSGPAGRGHGAPVAGMQQQSSRPVQQQPGGMPAPSTQQQPSNVGGQQGATGQMLNPGQQQLGQQMQQRPQPSLQQQPQPQGMRQPMQPGPRQMPMMQQGQMPPGMMQQPGRPMGGAPGQVPLFPGARGPQGPGGAGGPGMPGPGPYGFPHPGMVMQGMPHAGMPQNMQPGMAPQTSQPMRAQPGPGVHQQPGGPMNSQWTEHRAPDGRPYYYNMVTKQSVWQKPDELKKKEEEEAAAKAKPIAKPPSAWKEFKSPDGRPYYYNSVTQQSTWTMPDELRDELAAKAAASLAAVEESNAAGDQPNQAASAVRSEVPPSNGQAAPKAASEENRPKKEVAEKKSEAEPVKPLVFATKEEALAAFRGMLDELASTSMNWEKALKKIANDPRYTALKTLGERKHVFHEWVTKTKKKEEEEKKLRRKRNKEAFFELLEEANKSEKISIRTRYREAAAILGEEERWTNLDNEEEREDLFEDFMTMLDKHEKMRLRAEREEHMAEVKRWLDGKEDLDGKMDWKEFEEAVGTVEAFKKLEKNDRVRIYDDWRREQARKEEELRRKEKEAARAKRKELKSAFWKYLESLYEEGKMDRKSEWRDLKATVKETKEYAELEEADKGAAHELFEDYAEELDKDHREKRRIVKDILHEKGTALTATTSYEDFCALLEGEPREGEEEKVQEDRDGPQHPVVHGRASSIPEKMLKKVFEDLVQKEKDKIKAEEKKRKLRKEDFLVLLDRCHEIEPGTTWEEAKRLIEGRSAFKALKEEEREEYFGEFLKTLEGGKKRSREDEEEEPGEIPTPKAVRSS